MFFDAVLDENGDPIFNDTPAVTKKWLNDHPSPSNLIVVDGKTLTQQTVAEYLNEE
jgi:hypothetical protein